MIRIFLAPHAKCQVNVDFQTVSDCERDMKERPSIYSLEKAQHHVYELMKRDSYPRFLRSDQFQKLKDSAVVPTKKNR